MVQAVCLSLRARVHPKMVRLDGRMRFNKQYKGVATALFGCRVPVAIGDLISSTILGWPLSSILVLQ